MESLNTRFFSPILPSPQNPFIHSRSTSGKKGPRGTISCSISPDPWTLSDGSPDYKPKPFKKNQKKPLSDDNARRIIKAKARYLSQLRKNQGSQAQTPKWITRTPEQMALWLEDDRAGHLYGKHVVAAIKLVRSLSGKKEGSYDMREVMSGFITKLTFREMCVVLKEQRGWRQVRDFFAWMKLQLCYRPSVIVYTIVLRIYGQVGKIKLAEEIFLEMLEAGCEPDEVACGTMLCTYARWGRHKEMISFYSAVRQREIIPAVSVFNFMISSLQKKKLHAKVVELWKQMVLLGVKPNQFTYTVAISSYAKDGFVIEAYETFEKMKKSGFIPEEVTYSLLISLFVKNENTDGALKLYDDMKSHGIVPSNYTAASLLALHYKNGDFNKALAHFSEMEHYKIVADEVIYGMLIRIYGKLGLYEDAERTFKEIKQLGLLKDEKTFVAMAQVYLNSGNHEKALNVLEMMKSGSVKFSKFAYSSLLHCYTRKEDVASAEVAFQALCKSEVPEVASYSDMLNLYIKVGFFEKAKLLLAQMEKDQLQFDEELCRNAMKLYSKEGMINEAEKLVEKMHGNGCNVDKFIQTTLMVMYGGSGNTEKAKDIFNTLERHDAIAVAQMLRLYLGNDDSDSAQTMVKALLETTGGLSVTSQLINKFIREDDISKARFLYDYTIQLGYIPEDAAIASLIRFYGKQDQIRQAQEVFTHLSGSPSIGKPIYSSMVDSYVKCGKLGEAYKLYEEMVEKGHNQDSVIVSIIVNALTKSGKYQEAKKVVQNIFKSAVELDTVAYNTCIKALLEAGKLYFAAQIYDRMVASSVIPSIQTYCTMISVYGRGGKLDKAVEMFNTACSSGLPIDEKAYTNMIVYYGKAGKSGEALLLFNEMQEKGIRPGKVSYNTMINIYATAGLHLEAERLFQDMQRDGCSPDSFTYLALIRAYSVCQKYAEAEEVIHKMKHSGIYPTCAHFNCLISALTKVGLIHDAERLYEEIKQAGLCPDLACYRTMLRGYMDYGYAEKGIHLFERINGSLEQDKFILSAAFHLYKFIGNEFKAGNIVDIMNREGVAFLKNLKVGSRTSLAEVNVLAFAEVPN